MVTWVVLDAVMVGVSAWIFRLFYRDMQQEDARIPWLFDAVGAALAFLAVRDWLFYIWKDWPR